MINSFQCVVFDSKTRKDLTFVRFQEFAAWQLRRCKIIRLLHFRVKKISRVLKHAQSAADFGSRSETGGQTVHAEGRVVVGGRRGWTGRCIQGK